MEFGKSSITRVQNTFIISFIAVIWRRIWVTSLTYCDHNDININHHIVIKSLKYNLLSPTGICNTIKPYLIKALNIGFLMPQDYKDNMYAERAVKLFSEAYEISYDMVKELEFIHEYASYVFEYDDPFLHNLEESFDAFNDIDGFDTSSTNITHFDGDHKCKLCDLMETWDIELNLVYSDDIYQNIIMYGLIYILKNYHVAYKK